MKASEAGETNASPRTARRATKRRAPAQIHPVIVYPYRHPSDYSDLEQLYGLAAQLDGQRDAYARPITVMDRKTYYAMAKDDRFRHFRDEVVGRHSDLLDAWCVDTCQMWYSGLAMAFERGAPDDVYWLIPGDFNYATAGGREVLGRLKDLPAICQELEEDVCVGEIATDHNASKQLIDTYGTFALLYNWFPEEAQEIRQYTERPRSEFFALRHSFLGEMLNRRWYAYEQTVVILLHAIFGKKRIARFFVGNISDLQAGRDTLASAVQQIERTERVLKTLWRERNGARRNWIAQYRDLETRSERVRQTALIVMENLLG